MEVLSIGLMVCDIMVKPVDPKVFTLDSIRLDTMKMASGGDALNAAVNMAKLGTKVGLVGRIGMDGLGDFLRNEVSKAGVDTRGMVTSNEFATSTSIVLIEESGERHFAYYGKTNDTLSPEDITDELLNDAKIVHVGSAMALAGLEGKSLADLFRKAKAHGAMTSMDLTWDNSGVWMPRIEQALPYLDIFIPSYEEACQITGLTDVHDMRSFFSTYGMKVFGVKLGDKGCYITDFEEEFEVPAFKVEHVVDTTGAGDSFMAGFLSGVVRGWDIHKSAVFAAAVASFCVQAMGASTGIRSYDETIAFIQSKDPGFMG